MSKYIKVFAFLNRKVLQMLPKCDIFIKKRNNLHKTIAKICK